MMMFVFNPPLAASTPVHLPHHPLDLIFSATCSSPRDYYAAQQSGVRIELWSDISSSDQWNALAFESSESTQSFILRIPSTAFLHSWRSQFAFTYRLIYPGGHINWLGGYADNGNLIVLRDDERLTLTAPGWSFDAPRWFFASPQQSLALPIASLTDKAQWAIWSFLDQRIPRLLSLDDHLHNIKSALLVPYHSSNAIVPLAPILLTSQDAVVSITSGGVITLDGPPSSTVALQTLSTLDQKHIIPTHSAAQSIEGCDLPHHVLLFSPPSASSDTACLSIISIVSATNSQIQVPLSQITSILDSETPGLALYPASAPGSACFVSTAVDTYTLTVGFGGSQLVLSPVYDLVQSLVSLAVLAPHTRVKSPPHEHRIPTPPPSYIQIQASRPLNQSADVSVNYIADQKEKDKIVKRASTELQVTTQIISFVRLFSDLILNMFSWFLIFCFGRLFASRVPPPANYAHAIAMGEPTPTGRNGISADAITPVILTCDSEEQQPSSPETGDWFSIERVLNEKLKVDENVDKLTSEVASGSWPSPSLTFNVLSGQEHIRLLLRGKEEDARRLEFVVDEKEALTVSFVKASGSEDDDCWMVELSPGSGVLIVRSTLA